MSKFIEFPSENSNVLINIENITYISKYSRDESKTSIHFCVQSSDGHPKSIIINVAYDVLKEQLPI